MGSLVERVQKLFKTLTKQERRQLLIDAHIITEDGTYNPKYFTEETVQKSKKKLETNL